MLLAPDGNNNQGMDSGKLATQKYSFIPTASANVFVPAASPPSHSVYAISVSSLHVVNKSYCMYNYPSLQKSLQVDTRNLEGIYQSTWSPYGRNKQQLPWVCAAALFLPTVCSMYDTQ
jgi:hypothetical protein